MPHFETLGAQSVIHFIPKGVPDIFVVSTEAQVNKKTFIFVTASSTPIVVENTHFRFHISFGSE